MRSYKTTVYACYLGSITQAALINLTPVLFAVLLREYGLSYGALGFLVLTNFVTQVGADVAFSKAVDRHGFRPFVLGAGVLSLVGLSVFAAAPLLFPAHPLVGFFAGTVIFSGAGGLLELLLSPIVDALPGEEKTRAMALLHSMYCWGQAATVLVTTAALALGVPWQAIVLGWMLLPAADLLLFLRAPLNHKPPEETLPIRGLARQRVFWLALGAIVFGAAAEVTMAQYASSFLDLGLGIPKLFGDVAGMCGFALMMGLGRTLLGLWGDRWDLPRVLGASALLAACCYLTAAALPAAAVVACAATGLFVAGLWPGTLVVASRKMPLAGASMFALLSAGGDLGASLGGWITGVGADALLAAGFSQHTALRAALGAAALFPLGAWLFYRRLRKQDQ